MDSLVAQADAVGPPKKSKTAKTKSLNVEKSTDQDPTLASIAARTRIPKSLSNALENDPREKKKAAKKGKYGYINDLKLRAHLSRMEEGKKDWKERMEDVQMLNVGEVGGIEAEGELERTWKLTQNEIVASVSAEDARSRSQWKLEGGPYSCRYTKNGR